MRRLKTIVPTLLLAALFAAVARAQRDAVPDASPGEGVIHGRVVGDARDSAGISAASVTLTNEASNARWFAVTDEHGAFTVDALPYGRYRVAVAKAAFVSVSPGTSLIDSSLVVSLDVAHATREVSVFMSRGGILAGVVTDELGRPIDGVTVSARIQRYVPSLGDVALQEPVPSAAAVTNGRGAFRVYGLPAGRYTLVALPTLAPGVSGTTAERATSDLVDRVIASRVSGSGGVAGHMTMVIATPLYFPGTTDIAARDEIPLTLGEERDDLIFVARLQAATQIQGQVTGNNAPSLRPRITLTPADRLLVNSGLGGPTSTALGDDGRFRFSGVAPGAYRLLAEATDPFAKPGSTEPRYSTADVDAHADVTDVQMEWRPAGSLEGSLEFASMSGEGPRGEDIANIKLYLAAPYAGPQLLTPPISVDDHGRFRVRGLPPGTVRLLFSKPVSLAKWRFAGLYEGDREDRDFVIDLGPAQSVNNVRLRFTDEPSTVEGHLIANGECNCVVVAFAIDRADWKPLSLRMQYSKPDSDGGYRFIGLPPGAYFVGVVTEFDASILGDPAVLDQLAAASVQISVAEGGHVVQDVTTSAR